MWGDVGRWGVEGGTEMGCEGRCEGGEKEEEGEY